MPFGALSLLAARTIRSVAVERNAVCGFLLIDATSFHSSSVPLTRIIGGMHLDQ